MLLRVLCGQKSTQPAPPVRKKNVLFYFLNFFLLRMMRHKMHIKYPPPFSCLRYVIVCSRVLFKYLIMCIMCVHNLSDGVFCHVAHLCNAHKISGLETSAAHNFPIALRTGSCCASFIAASSVGASSSFMSSVGAGFLCSQKSEMTKKWTSLF